MSEDHGARQQRSGDVRDVRHTGDLGGAVRTLERRTRGRRIEQVERDHAGVGVRDRQPWAMLEFFRNTLTLTHRRKRRAELAVSGQTRGKLGCCICLGRPRADRSRDSQCFRDFGQRLLASRRSARQHVVHMRSRA